MKAKLRKAVVVGGGLLAALILLYGFRTEPQYGPPYKPIRAPRTSAIASLQSAEAAKAETFLMLSNKTDWAEQLRFAIRFAAFTNVTAPDTTVEPWAIHQVIYLPTVDVSDRAYPPPSYRLGLIDTKAQPDFDIPAVNENHQ